MAPRSTSTHGSSLCRVCRTSSRPVSRADDDNAAAWSDADSAADMRIAIKAVGDTLRLFLSGTS